MKHHRTRKAVSLLLSLLMAVQLLPLEAGAASAMEGKKAGDVLFNNGEKDRLFVSETAYSLAPGITEYVTYTNEPDGLNQNIDYFCEVDLSQAEVMTGYAGMENILEKKTINWRMQTVSGQVEDTQSYFTRSEKYADCTIAAALNADYYNMATGQPTGLLIIDGKVYNPRAQMAQFWRYYPEELRELFEHSHTYVDDMDRLIAERTEPVEKVYISYCSKEESVRARAAAAKLPYYATGAGFADLEVMNPATNKGLALGALAETLGIAQSEVLAIGDSSNDAAMLAYAGVGVAMANGEEELKKIADRIAPSNEEGGVADILEMAVRGEI